MRFGKNRPCGVALLLMAVLWNGAATQLADDEGAGCTIDSAVKDSLLEPVTGAWSVQAALVQGFNIQDVIDCTDPDDVVQLPIENVLQPPATLVVPWSLTIDGAASEEGEASERGSARGRLTCPKGGGLFRIGCVSHALAASRAVHCRGNASLTLVNVAVENCRLSEEESVAAVLASDGNCSSGGGARRRIALHNVTFAEIHNAGGSLGLSVRDPDCHSVLMENVEFLSSSYRTPCVLSRTTELRNVRLHGISSVEDEEAAVFLLPRRSTAIISSMNATDNTAPSLIRASAATVTVSESTFLNNVVGAVGMLVAESTSLDVVDSVFRQTTSSSAGSVVGLTGDSPAGFWHCSFEQNSNRDGGSCVGARNITSDLSFASCRLISNSGWSNTSRGGAVYVSADSGESAAAIEAKFSDCTLSKNRAAYGGAINCEEGVDAELSGCTVRDNIAAVDGGALYVNGTGDLERSVFEKNEAGGDGGAVRGSDIRIRECKFRRNDAIGSGGAVSAEAHSNSSDSVFSENVAGGLGGALSGGGFYIIYMSCWGFYAPPPEDGDFQIRNCTLRNNSAGTYGGAVGSHGQGDVKDTVFERNEASEDGGAVTCWRASAHNCTFRNNNAAKNGGALHAQAAAAALDCVFINNVAGMDGGAVVASVYTPFSSSNCSNITTIFLYFGGFQSRNCTFRNNSAGTSGGALHSFGRSDLERNILEENEAGLAGGAMYGWEIKIRNCTLRKNSASESGGALYANNKVESDDNVFSENAAGAHGGGVYSSEIHIGICTFRNNTAGTHGGALYVDGQTDLEGSFFEGNAAGVDGGALHGGALQDFTIWILNCTFWNNSASENGGSLYADMQLGLEGNVFEGNEAGVDGGAVYGGALQGLAIDSHNCTFRNNAARENGGALFGDREVRLEANRFSENKAERDGGGIFARGALTVTECLFENNSAELSGGAVHSVASATADLCTFSKNIAKDEGGAVRSAGSLSLTRSTVYGNSALKSGGALSVEGDVVAVACNVSENWAGRDGGGALFRELSSLTECTFRGNWAGMNGGAIAHRLDGESFFRDSRVVANKHDYRANQATADVGVGSIKKAGAALVSVRTQWLYLQHCTLYQNKAASGGAIFVGVTPEEDDRRSLCAEATNISSNTAAVGGGVFLEGTGSVTVDGEELTFPFTEAADDDCHVLRDRGATGFVAVSGNSAASYGANWASATVGYCVFLKDDDGGNKTVRRSGRDFDRVECNGSAPFPSIEVWMHDAFFQGPSLTEAERSALTDSPIDETSQCAAALQANLLSPELKNSTNDFLRADLTVDVKGGVAPFMLGVPLKPPGQYQLVVGVDGFDQETKINIAVSPCAINEAVLDQGNDAFCRQCGPDEYSFVEDQETSTCQSCPEKGDCSTNFILPRRGYWNPSPCSHRVQECTNEEACRLNATVPTSTTCNFTDEEISDYQDAICEKNYRGPLCGSCKVEAGTFKFATCRYCVAVGLAVLALAGAFLYQLALNAIQIQATAFGDFDSGTRIRSLGLRRTLAFVEREGTIHFSDSRTTHAASAIEDAASSPEASEATKVKALIAQYKLSELLKVIINFAQTVGIAATQNLAWMGPIPKLFDTFDGIGSTFRLPATFALDCMLGDYGAHSRTVIRQLVLHLLPLFLYSVIILLLSATKWLVYGSASGFLQDLVLAAVIVIYNTYFSSTTVALDTFHCVKVYDGTGVEVLDASNQYWALDTSVKCYEGEHFFLVLLSSTFILVFSIGFPAIIAFSLTSLNRSGQLYEEKNYQEALGFLFTGYKRDFVHWDTVIMMRKACVSFILTFGLTLDSNLQSALVAIVLTFSCLLQTLCNPFRDDLEGINVAESLSLTVSTVSFLCSVVVNTYQLRHEPTRHAAASLLIASNVGTFFFFMYLLVGSKYRQMRLHLEAASIHLGREPRPLKVVRLYVSKCLAEYRASAAIVRARLGEIYEEGTSRILPATRDRIGSEQIPLAGAD